MFYVYVDYREDSGEPFYVGKCKRARVDDYVRRNRKWHNIADFAVRGSKSKFLFEWAKRLGVTGE